MTTLAEVERPLALFAEGIAGRYFHIRNLSERSDAEVRVSDASHDAYSIYLPGSVDYFSIPESNAATYRLMVLQQLGFREFGTYSFDINQARRECADLREHELPDQHRESDLELLFRHFEYPFLARRLFTVIETTRIETAVLRHYPGAIPYRKRLQDKLDAEYDDELEDDGVNSALQTLSAFLHGVPHAQSNLASCVSAVRDLAATVYTSVQATIDCYRRLAHLIDRAIENSEDLIEATEGPPMEWLQRQVRLEDWQDDLESMNAQLAAFELTNDAAGKKVAMGETEGDGTIRETNTDMVRERDQAQRRIDMERSAIRHALGHEHENVRSFLYDEWDYLHSQYLRGWCRVYEEHLKADQSGDGIALLHTLRPLAQGVRKRFEQIRPAGYQRVNKVTDGDELYLSAVVDVRADLRVGSSPDERVYSRRERQKRDVGAAFLVDLSASTDDLIDQAPTTTTLTDRPDAPAGLNLRDPYSDDDDEFTFDLESRREAEDTKRRIIDIQREAVLLMAGALEALGDQYGVFGFSGYGHDCVEFYIAKEFRQPLDARALDAIAAMTPKRSTRMGAAIRHAAAKLEASGSALKVLMIISDGFPQDCDYGPDRGNHEYGVQDTAKALREAEQRGIKTLCITVDRSGHDYLRRMCPEEHYMVIEETEELPSALQKAYRRLTHL
ncbi:MAG: VWA domain-containing protein [Pseudomonadales bacterium]